MPQKQNIVLRKMSRLDSTGSSIEWATFISAAGDKDLGVGVQPSPETWTIVPADGLP